MTKLLTSFMAMAALIGASLWTLVYPRSSHRLSRALAKFALILGIVFLIMGWYARPALAKVDYLKEADQWIYQSQTVLSDTAGFPWEVTALKQMDGTDQGLSLRLVTPSADIHLDAVKPLVIVTQLEKPLVAVNITRQQFVGDLPEPNVGQYNIQPLLAEFKKTSSLQLQVPTRQDVPAILSIPTDVLEEWTTVGSCSYIVCADEAIALVT